MANQDPQPEVYSVTSTFAPSATSGTTQTTNVTTSQANNEEVRIYGVQVDMQGENFTALSPITATNCDFSLTITVGPNNVPSQPIRLRPIWCAETTAMYLTSPILVLFQQPLQVTVTNNQALTAGAGNGRIVTVNFLSELAIQKVACAPSATDYPRSPMGM